MNMDSKYQLKIYGATIADINYFNDKHKIIRIEFNKNFYDFKCLLSNEVPNPVNHIAIVVTSEESLSPIKAITADQLNYLPGIIDQYGNLNDLPLGFVYIVSKKQTFSTTNQNSAGSTFSIDNTNMNNVSDVVVAISPPSSKDYTNTEDIDNNDNNIGLFINSKGNILIKSGGSSITMGKEGIYFGGNIYWEHSEHVREWMRDNPIKRFIPSTLPTAAISIDSLPNVATFANIANGARKVRHVVSSLNSITNIIKVQ